MSTVRKRWHRVAMVAMAATLSLGVVACGSDTEEAKGGESVTIKHKLGETTVTGTPTRVVALGNQWLDAVQSLGVTPVGYIDNVSVYAGGAAVPWEPAALKDVKPLQPGTGIPEQVAELAPDLILAASFAVDQTTYDKLSKIAPVIVDLSTAQIDPWQDQVKALGKVFHKEAEADKVVADVNGKIDAVAQKYPTLKGKTFLTCFLAGASQLMILADDKDGSAEMFTRLGMTVPPQLAAEASKGGRLALSPERIRDLTSDLLICSAAGGDATAYKNLPGYNQLPAVEKGSAAIFDTIEISGLNQPTPLSVPYLLDKLEPSLANAAK